MDRNIRRAFRAKLGMVKPKKRSFASWCRELDKECRSVVFQRDGHRCLRCNGTEFLQWAHVYSRSYKCLRWVPDNSMTLCARCHRWWHQNPLEAVQWFRSIKSPEVVESLHVVAVSLPKVEYEQVREMLRSHSTMVCGPR